MADTPSSRRAGVSGDVEVSTYLEIAREKSGEAPVLRAAAFAASREAVVVIDFGSQFSQLIARRVREASVYCELVPHDAPWEEVARLNPKGFVILSGGPASVYERGAPLAPTWVFEKGCPCSASATACSSCPPARRQGGAVRRTRVRPRRRPPGRQRLADLRRPAAVDAGLDEPRRPHHAAAARLPVDRLLRQLAVRGDERRQERLRHPVPPGGRAHAARQAGDRELPLQGLRLPRRLDRRQLRRR